jgi:hypothetical protein
MSRLTGASAGNYGSLATDRLRHLGDNKFAEMCATSLSTTPPSGLLFKDMFALLGPSHSSMRFCCTRVSPPTSPEPRRQKSLIRGRERHSPSPAPDCVEPLAAPHGCIAALGNLPGPFLSFFGDAQV